MRCTITGFVSVEKVPPGELKCEPGGSPVAFALTLHPKTRYRARKPEFEGKVPLEC